MEALAVFENLILQSFEVAELHVAYLHRVNENESCMYALDHLLNLIHVTQSDESDSRIGNVVHPDAILKRLADQLFAAHIKYLTMWRQLLRQAKAKTTLA